MNTTSKLLTETDWIRPVVRPEALVWGHWKVVGAIDCFSSSVGSSHAIVEAQGQRGFLKINWRQGINSSSLHYKADTTRHNFEVALLRHLRPRNLRTVANIIDDGVVTDDRGLNFDAIVLELAEENAAITFQFLSHDKLWWLSSHLMQVAHALTNLHQLGVVHRDLTPQNILLTDSRSRSLLSDFGTAYWLGNPSPTDVLKVTTPYKLSPPERYIHYSWSSRWQKLTAMELWQFGSLIYLAIVGEPPLKPILGDRFQNLEGLERDCDHRSHEMIKHSERGFRDSCSILANEIQRKVPKEIQPQAGSLFTIYKTACNPNVARRGHTTLTKAGPDQRFSLAPYLQDLIALVKKLKQLQPAKN